MTMQVTRAIALTPILFLAVFSSRSEAQVVQVSHWQTDLQAAVCQNDWGQALRAIAPLIGSPGIADSYRWELIRFRGRLEDWRAADAEFINVPGCGGSIAVPSVSAPSPSRSLNWQRAVESVSAP